MSETANETPTLLLVDDDATFCMVLGRALEKRGFAVTVAHSVEDALPVARAAPPEYAVVDMKLGDSQAGGNASGLVLVRALHELDPATRIVVLTGYASIATAVEAIKLGARHYLVKPANTDDIEAAFARAQGDADVGLTERQTSIKTLEWERIHEMLAETGFNISEAARRLGMHRRTLARKLEKQRIK